MAGKRDHFVPQHYLRKFRFNETEQISIAVIEPFKFVGLGGINRQCQEDYFYEQNEALNDLLWRSEADISPVLIDVSRKMDFDSKERVALNMLAVLLNWRTKRAVEEAKAFDKYVAYEVIKSAIERGELPEPKGGWKEGMMDFGGVPGFLIQNAMIPCWMEMQTLECKLLRASAGNFFVTSDHPVVLLNQFCAHLEPHRSFVGFSRSGFQVIVPISPILCLFFYDAKVYKVGSKRRRSQEISREDVEILNALQVQSADRCLYFHSPTMENEVQSLVSRYGNLRVPVGETLRRLPGRNQTEEILHMRAKSAKIPQPWAFCRFKRHVNSRPGDRRDPAWTATISRLMTDINERPGDEDIFSRLRRILADPPQVSPADSSLFCADPRGAAE